MKTKPKPGRFCQVAGPRRWPYMGELPWEPFTGLGPEHVTQKSECLKATKAGRSAPRDMGTAVQTARPQPIWAGGCPRSCRPTRPPCPRPGASATASMTWTPTARCAVPTRTEAFGRPCLERAPLTALEPFDSH